MNIAPQYRNNPDYVILENLLLKRFEDKNINTDDNISSIKTILRNRYLVRRTKSRFLEGENKWIFPDVELTPCSQELTTELINSDISTVPNYSKLMLGR